ncbi:MAG: hypothetical protein QG675_75 [Patescibacteria group bacterium]|jgi:hypothetical protein|nr:hypothetical protein [Patescibacteria group bacterium]
MSKLEKASKFAIVSGTSTIALLPVTTLAATEIDNGANSAQPSGTPEDLSVQVTNITNTMLLVIGIVAVIMLIVGGFRYVLSNGNEKAISGAKDTILYAIIGIVVALLAYAIVNFVTGRFT